MKRCRLLIVDDEPEALEAMRRLAESAGYEIAGTARDGLEAVDLNLALCPDAILLDLKMPRMNGLQAAERIMATRPVPVIACTAYHDEPVIRAAARAGVHAYVVKPFRIADLAPAVAVARSRFEDICKLSDRVNSLRRSVAARRWVEHAKVVLMERTGMSEGEAHRYLQTESQKRGIPLVDIAKQIALAHENERASGNSSRAA